MVRKEEMEIGQSERVAGERPQGNKRFNVKYDSITRIRLAKSRVDKKVDKKVKKRGR